MGFFDLLGDLLGGEAASFLKECENPSPPQESEIIRMIEDAVREGCNETYYEDCFEDRQLHPYGGRYLPDGTVVGPLSKEWETASLYPPRRRGPLG